MLSQIRSGTLRVGERLPSLREMSRYFGCSVNTVIQSYHHLEAEGYVRARPQSGFYVRAARLGKADEVHPQRFPLLPVEVSLSEEVYRYMDMRGDRRRVNLGVALPSRRLMPVRHLQRTMAGESSRFPPTATPASAWTALRRPFATLGSPPACSRPTPRIRWASSCRSRPSVRSCAFRRGTTCP